MQARVAKAIKIAVAAGILMGTCAEVAASRQQGAPRLYRMMQGGREVGRETYRRAATGIERSVVIPLIDVRIDSRTEFDASGRFVRFSAEGFNAGGDSSRGTLRIEVAGDSLVETRVMGGVERVRSLRGPADGVIPSQSLTFVTELAERSGGRDTVFRMVPMGGDSAVPVTVRFRGERAEVTLAGLVALGGTRYDAAIEVPVQRIIATPWNGVDSLPPLPGLRRPQPDYTAPPGAHYTAEELRVPIRMPRGDTFSLAGTLTLPAGASGPVPVVITISGSGRQPRDEDLWPLITGYRPFREIAERLAREGIGVFRFADRGVDGSTGGDLESTTADHAEEVRQIVRFLRQRPGVDGRRIALLGHSEGGIIGPMVAADDRSVAAVVILAGPSRPGAEIIRYQLRRPIETAVGLSDSIRSAQLALVEDQVRSWLQLSSWTRWFATYDPLTTARRVRQPVLILHGALDRQVTADQAAELGAAIRSSGNRDVTVRVYPGLNHLFLPTDGDGSPSEYGALRHVNLPAVVLDEVTGWLAARLRR